MTDGYQPGWGEPQPDPTTQMDSWRSPSPPPSKKRNPLLYVLIPVGACLALAVVAGVIGAIAGPSEKDEPNQAVASTTTETATTTSTEAQPTSTEAPTTTDVPTTTTMPPTTVAPVLMPNVVCMVLQDAQDAIQAAGVFFSRSTDATGQGRFQVDDRNWIVTAQTPAPGTPIGENDAVLSVVKLEEPHSC